MTNRLAIYHYYDVILRCEGLPLNIPVCCLKWIVSRWISTRCATGNWNKYHSIQIHAELSCVWSVFNACIYIQFAFRLQFATEFTPYLHKVISLSLYPTPPSLPSVNMALEWDFLYVVTITYSEHQRLIYYPLRRDFTEEEITHCQGLKVPSW